METWELADEDLEKPWDGARLGEAVEVFGLEAGGAKEGEARCFGAVEEGAGVVIAARVATAGDRLRLDREKAE